MSGKAGLFDSVNSLTIKRALLRRISKRQENGRVIVAVYCLPVDAGGNVTMSCKQFESSPGDNRGNRLRLFRCVLPVKLTD